jgi:hypothetical protein
MVYVNSIILKFAAEGGDTSLQCTEKCKNKYINALKKTRFLVVSCGDLKG